MDGRGASTGPLIEISGKLDLVRRRCRRCRARFNGAADRDQRKDRVVPELTDDRVRLASTGPLIEISGKPHSPIQGFRELRHASTGPLIEISGKPTARLSARLGVAVLQRGR